MQLREAEGRACSLSLFRVFFLSHSHTAIHAYVTIWCLESSLLFGIEDSSALFAASVANQPQTTSIACVTSSPHLIVIIVSLGPRVKK
jgi:hypothetical protein